jgi:hypothetical protein
MKHTRLTDEQIIGFHMQAQAGLSIKAAMATHYSLTNSPVFCAIASWTLLTYGAGLLIDASMTYCAQSSRSLTKSGVSALP